MARRRASDGDRRARRSWFGRKLVSGLTGRADVEPCCVVGVLVLVDRGLPIDGLVTEIGRNSLLFRPASVYIFDRLGAEVTVRFGEQDVRGRIIEVGTGGYRVRLAAQLHPSIVQDVVVHFGLRGTGLARAPGAQEFTPDRTSR